MTTYGMIGEYPPTRSGLAHFAERLRAGLLADHAEEVRVVQVGEPPHDGDPAEIAARFLVGGTDAKQAAEALNGCDVAVVQHEFGIYGGADGEDILKVAELLSVPTIAVLHTVPHVPTVHQREVLEELADKARAVAVMSQADADRLLTDYAVDAAKVAVIEVGDWPAVSAAYGRLASLLLSDQAQLVM